MSEQVFIVGCGATGELVAARELARAHHVWALARSAQSEARLKDKGIEAVPGDLDNPASLAGLQVGVERLYYFAPPPPGGTDDPRLAAFLTALTAPYPRRAVLISTTAVYGDCQGAWVDEDQPTRPLSDRGQRRLAAESLWRDWADEHGVRSVVLRVAGIYGIGKLPVARLGQGRPVLLESQSPWSNRIHIDDLAEACLLAGSAARPAGIYNASDGHPSSMTDYFNRVADTLGLPRPPQIDRQQAEQRLSAGMLAYLSESKRIDNHRLREQLGLQLRYPTLERGLAACLDPDWHPRRDPQD
jgi:nucleoside-diphosphate-sugar epimerase